MFGANARKGEQTIEYGLTREGFVYAIMRSLRCMNTGLDDNVNATAFAAPSSQRDTVFLHERNVVSIELKGEAAYCCGIVKGARFRRYCVRKEIRNFAARNQVLRVCTASRRRNY